MTHSSADPGSASGLAFSVPDLLLARAWAEFHDLSIVVELDRRVDGRLCDEVLAFYSQDRRQRRWLMWRLWDGIMVEHDADRSTRSFASVVDALEALLPARS